MALPRDANPYQESLYAPMRRRGVRVRYGGELTRSHSLNLLLLPAETIAFRLRGGRIAHLHWTYGFRPPGAGRVPGLARAGRIWFGAWLGLCRALGVRLVWTAHNVVPHAPVFPDDHEARRALTRASRLVIAHSDVALEQLAAIGCRPRRSAVIGLGPSPPSGSPVAPLRERVPGEPLRLLFFGKVEPYKGVEDLLAALARVPADVAVSLTVAGECRDPGLRARLVALSADAGHPVDLRLAHLPDGEVEQAFAASHVVALPFRSITTSSSARFALDRQRPLLIPDLPALGDLPPGAVVRYDGGVAGLAAAIRGLATLSPGMLAEMGRAGAPSGPGWDELADRTLQAIAGLTPPGRSGARRARRLRTPPPGMRRGPA